MRRSLKLLINRLLIAFIVWLMPEGYEITLERQRVIKHIAKKNRLYENHDRERREILKNLYNITEAQAMLIWGEFEEVDRSTFSQSLPILAEIIPTKTLNDYFLKKNM